jgi:hypothetical protein
VPSGAGVTAPEFRRLVRTADRRECFRENRKSFDAVANSETDVQVVPFSEIKKEIPG